MRYKHFTSLLSQTAQIQACTGQKVLWLADIHPETVQIKAVELTILANGRESLLLDAGWPQLNAVQNGGVEDVDSGVDPITDELDRLFDKAVYARRVAWVMHHHTVLGRFFDLCYNDCALFTVRFVEVGQFLEGIVANDVRVEHEEGSFVFAEDFFGELEWASSAEWFGFDAELNVYVVFFFPLDCGC